MTDESDDREQGIAFGGFDDELEAVDYPITNAELVDRFGDRTVGTSDGEVTVRETLDPQADTTYGSTEDVRQAILNMVGGEAVGRQRYSDRGSVVQDETDGDDDQESF